MCAIKFLFMLSAVLILQVHCGVVRDDDDGDGGNEVIVVNTVTLEVIETVVDVITNLSIYAINGFNGAAATIEHKVNDIQKSLIDSLWDNIVNKLDAMESDASDFLKVAIQCSKANGDDLKAMVYEFSSQSIICETQKTVLTLNTFVPILTEIHNTNEELKNFTEQLKGCGNDAAAIPCLDEITDEMTDGLVQLWNVLKDQVTEVSKLIQNISKLGSLCHEDAESDLGDAFKSISTAISDCIQENILNNNST